MVSRIIQMCYDRMEKMKVEVEVPIHKRFEEVKVKIEAIRDRIKLLEEKVEQDRNDFPRQINERSRELLKQLKEFKAKFKAEQVLRENREKELVKDIEDQHYRVQDLFEQERVSWCHVRGGTHNDGDILSFPHSNY